MKMELNRRIFLALLGAASAATALPRNRPVRTAASMMPSNGIYFFSNRGNHPAGRPRTAAITYVPMDLEAHEG